MDYQKIKYFLKAAETLNFSEAARQMYITPQSFGKQIALLEQEMGFPLFERSTRQTRLTASGKIVYDNLSSRVVELEKEYQKMCAMGSKRSKQIRIGVFNALSRTKVVSPIVNSILANYPDRDVSIRMDDMGALKVDFQNGQLDLCITTTHEGEARWQDSVHIPLATSPARIVVSKYHKWNVQETVTVEDMKQCNYIKMKVPDSFEGDFFERVPCKNKFVADNFETLCLMLDRGDYFSLMNAELDAYCEKGAKTFSMPWNPFDFTLTLVYNKNNPHAFLPELCQFIQEVFEV